MPSVTIELPADVMRALDRQARALLLSRRTYIRAVLAAVAAQAEREIRNAACEQVREDAQE